MAIDLAAIKAKLAAKKLEGEAIAAKPSTDTVAEVSASTISTPTSVTTTVPMMAVPAPDQSVSSTAPSLSIGSGSSRTTDINHLDFLSKIQELEEAIHTQHPRMPVLLMLIHKQISADPELVSVLSEEDIGIIVNGLKVQTKTELVGTIAKQSKAKDKKTKLSADMF